MAYWLTLVYLKKCTQTMVISLDLYPLKRYEEAREFGHCSVMRIKVDKSDVVAPFKKEESHHYMVCVWPRKHDHGPTSQKIIHWL